MARSLSPIGSASLRWLSLIAELSGSTSRD
jgi:hypothetical protein